MTTRTEQLRTSLRAWARKLRPIAKSEVTNIFLEIVSVIGENFMALAFATVIAGFIGAAIIQFGPYGLNLPQFLGTLFAHWCAERGSCDLTTNLMGVALGFYLTMAIAVAMIISIRGKWIGEEEKEYDGSIYSDVRDAIFGSGVKGITPRDVSKATGISIADVHVMIGFMFDDADIEIVNPGAYGAAVRYRKFEIEAELANPPKPLPPRVFWTWLVTLAIGMIVFFGLGIYGFSQQLASVP